MTRKIDFTDIALYAVTPSTKNPQMLLETIDKLLAGGVDAIQLRGRDLSDRDTIQLARTVKARCAATGTLLLVNNRPDIALAADADGVHLGHEDVPIALAREIIGHRRIIGASTHSLPQALEAQKNGADYVSCGPLWATPTKPQYPAVGTGLVGLYNAALKVPFVAIGGIDGTNIDQVLNAGAKCVAIVRALFETEAPTVAAKNFREKILRNREKILA